MCLYVAFDKKYNLKISNPHYYPLYTVTGLGSTQSSCRGPNICKRDLRCWEICWGLIPTMCSVGLYILLQKYRDDRT